MLASDAADPAETAARNLDWQAFAATLNEQDMEVLQCLADDVRLQEVATRRGVGRSTVKSWRNRLTELVRTFMGTDVLHLIQRTPRWRENLTALRDSWRAGWSAVWRRSTAKRAGPQGPAPF